MALGDLERPLAEFALRTAWEDLDAQPRRLAETLFLDGLACAFTGARAAARESFAAAARMVAGTGDSHVVVGASAGSLGEAVLLNGWQTTATTMCDVYRDRMCHVTPGVLPAVLAGLSEREVTREELLASLLVGVEVTTRLCRAMDEAAYVGSRWHAPGVIGPFGAATSYGRLIGLDEETLAQAWGAAGLQSAGTFAAIGSPGVKTTQARGAWSGVTAAVLAAHGHGGRPDHLEHPHGGLFESFGGADPASVVDALGTEWVGGQLSLRRWPGSSSLQSLIEATLALAEGPLPDRMTIGLPSRSFALAATPDWGDELTALQSARWIAGVVWTDGSCWLEQFAADRLADATLGAQVRARAAVALAADVPDGGVRLTVVRGGEETVAQVDVPLGSPARPLEPGDVAAKLAAAAGESRAAEIVDLVTGVARWSANRLLDLLVMEDCGR